MRTQFSLVVVMALCVSCSDIPTPMPGRNGEAAHARIFGGKGAITYNADGSMSYVFNQEKTAQHFFQFLALAISQGLTALVDLEKQVTSQMLAGEITKREGQAQLAAIAQAKIAAQGSAVGTAAGAGAAFKPIQVTAP